MRWVVCNCRIRQFCNSKSHLSCLHLSTMYSPSKKSSSFMQVRQSTPVPFARSRDAWHAARNRTRTHQCQFPYRQTDEEFGSYITVLLNCSLLYSSTVANGQQRRHRLYTDAAWHMETAYCRSRAQSVNSRKV